MNSTLKLALVPVFAAAIAALGIGAAFAQENQGGSGTGRQSYVDGGVSGTVAEPAPAPQTVAQTSSSSSGGMSSASRLYRTLGYVPTNSSDDIMIIIDDAAIASVATAGASSMGGTGGGFDPELEALLDDSDIGAGTEIGFLSPGDAVAFNNSQGAFPTDLTAAASEGGVSGARLWTAIILGLALVGLAGYAVNALLAYRRENDL